jgi:hypothetical protein
MEEKKRRGKKNKVKRGKQEQFRLPVDMAKGGGVGKVVRV